MEAHGASSRQIPPENQECDQPISCQNCFISYGDFCVTYSGKIQLLFDFAQRHGLILTEKKCPTCGEPCRVDYNRKAIYSVTILRPLS